MPSELRFKRLGLDNVPERLGVLDYVSIPRPGVYKVYVPRRKVPSQLVLFYNLHGRKVRLIVREQ